MLNKKYFNKRLNILHYYVSSMMRLQYRQHFMLGWPKKLQNQWFKMHKRYAQDKKYKHRKYIRDDHTDSTI